MLVNIIIFLIIIILSLYIDVNDLLGYNSARTLMNQFAIRVFIPNHNPPNERPLLNNDLPDRQNVHDTQLRQHLWKKYYTLRDEIYKTQTYDEINILHDRTFYKLCPNALKLRTILSKKNTVVDIHDNIVSELEIFSIVYAKFNQLELDNSLMISMINDCFDEDGDPWCIVGRVSRYIGMFAGVVEGYLGESEITERTMFAEALGKTQQLMKDYFDKNEEMKIIYDGVGTIEEEQKLNEFIDLCKKRIRSKLIIDYPTLPQNRINEVLEAF